MRGALPGSRPNRFKAGRLKASRLTEVADLAGDGQGHGAVLLHDKPCGPRCGGDAGSLGAEGLSLADRSLKADCPRSSQPGRKWKRIQKQRPDPCFFRHPSRGTCECWKNQWRDREAPLRKERLIFCGMMHPAQSSPSQFLHSDQWQCRDQQAFEKHEKVWKPHSHCHQLHWRLSWVF